MQEGQNKDKFLALLWLLTGFLCACGSSSGGGGASAQTVGGGTGGATQTSPSSMSAGDVSYVSFSGGSGSIGFGGVASGSSYELLVQSQATDASSRSFSLSSLSEAGKSLGLSNPLEDTALIEESPSVQQRFESTLRDEEKFLLNAPWDGGTSKSLSASKAAGGGGSGVSVALSVNDSATFRVLTSLTDVTQYAEVTGVVKCVNDTVAIYIDQEILDTNPSDLPQADIDTLCASFKTALVSEVSLFGSYPDNNGDGVAVALITSQVNRLGASGGGIVTGFFYSGDLFARSGSIPASNNREIVYLVSPDSGGLYGTKITNAFAMSNFLPAVFPHEMQHLINYYQHTIARSGNAEQDWLNEALSHLAEDLVGYGRENYSRVNLFLASPQSFAVVTPGSPSLAQRGGGYLFLRYLYEQSGKSATFLNSLIQTTNVGTANLEAAFPSSSSDFNEFGEFLRRWAVATAYTNRGITTSSNVIYEARTFNSSTGNWQGVCLVCTTSDGRGTVLDGPTFGTYSSSTNYSIRGTATRFLRLSPLPSTVTISANGAATPAAIVLRTK